MNYKFSDAEMLLATQFSYLNCDNMEGRTIPEIIEKMTNSLYTRDKNGNLVERPNLSDAQKGNIGTLKTINNMLEKTPGLEQSVQNWKLLDVRNDNNVNGYVGIAIDTGKDCIVANRGSEDIHDIKNLIFDWIGADLGLYNSTLTKQQADAEDYIKELYKKYGSKYESFSITGHSLGGNLAEHMAVSSPDGFKQKLDHVISFDGPGFSDEYIFKNKENIEKLHNMDHYQYSLVGTIFNPLPGSNFKTILATDDKSSDNILMKLLLRHDTNNIVLNNGKIVPGKEDALASLVGPLSKKLDEIDTNDIAALLNVVLGNVSGLGIAASLLLPFPTISAIGVTLFSGAALAASVGFVYHSIMSIYSHAIKEFKIIARNLSEKINNLYYQYIAPSVSGEYSVNIPAMRASGEEINRLATQLKRESEEIRRIRLNLPYWSEMGGLFRSRIMIVNNRIEAEINTIMKLGKLTPELMNRYNTADVHVQNMFSTI